jgi:hypothetical protein
MPTLGDVVRCAGGGEFAAAAVNDVDLSDMETDEGKPNGDAERARLHAAARACQPTDIVVSTALSDACLARGAACLPPPGPTR